MSLRPGLPAAVIPGPPRVHPRPRYHNMGTRNSIVTSVVECCLPVTRQRAATPHMRGAVN